jgi:hypothetical protein
MLSARAGARTPLSRGDPMMMKRPFLTLLLAAALSTAANAFPQDDATIARADAKVHDILDIQDYLAEVDRAMQMARKGDYGPIKKADLQRANAAHEEIQNLLSGHAEAKELKTEERVALLNAQELITAVLRSDEKNRKICRQVSQIGTRVSKAECMTVAQRERRAEQASRDMREIQRMNCRPDAPLVGGNKC